MMNAVASFMAIWPQCRIRVPSAHANCMDTRIVRINSQMVVASNAFLDGSTSNYLAQVDEDEKLNK